MQYLFDKTVLPPGEKVAIKTILWTIMANFGSIIPPHIGIILPTHIGSIPTHIGSIIQTHNYW